MDADRVLSHIRAINACRDRETALAAFTLATREYGFGQVFIGQLVNPANVALKDILYVSTWPEELQEQRIRMMAVLHDPIARCALRSKRPFRWADAMRHATLAGRKVVNLTRDYGVKDGYMFPMHALDSVTGGVSLGAEHLDVSPDEVAELELICSAAYYRLEAIEGPFPYQVMPDLSPREVEVVQLAAAGKTNADIGVLLGIQQDTVKKHLASAREKLSALNRAHAVSKAIASNQIFP